MTGTEPLYRAMMYALTDTHTKRGHLARRIAARYREMFGGGILDSWPAQTRWGT